MVVTDVIPLVLNGFIFFNLPPNDDIGDIGENDSKIHSKKESCDSIDCNYVVCDVYYLLFDLESHPYVVEEKMGGEP